MKTKPNESQWAVLAGLRFLLATLVVITHSAIVAPGSVLDKMFGNTGYPAVFGFLMISGYSIGSSITDRPEGYVYRRFKRIYPAYVIAIAIAFAVTLFGPLRLPGGQVIAQPTPGTIIGNLLMMQGILVPVMPTDGALWSLSIEWWCYMAGAILFRLGNRVAQIVTITSFVVMMLYCEQTRTIGGTELPFGWIVPMMLWAWLAGFVYFREQTKLNFSIMLFLPLIMFELIPRLQLASIVIAGSALTILFAGEIEIRSDKVRSVLNFLGNASYPLYLLHAPILFFIAARTSVRHGSLMIAIAVSVVLAGYYLTVSPINALRRKQKRQIRTI
ncbi:peptidoglycan/LPS O-acetylase OafA/YrhL [Paraburkholderia caballeronis]|uniref:acyltransferase family protein n=1 Tax=Paraburkholderia caballeronis TaxID=416943 RepID=UPI001064BBC5|nr:acyltransferase [Paraburkholderia caballeronis]TDV33879.1 peptidoglycan/LPS O-acetylase OafA/YrhL [Paraburkholderia caballeronis]